MMTVQSKIWGIRAILGVMSCLVHEGLQSLSSCGFLCFSLNVLNQATL